MSLRNKKAWIIAGLFVGLMSGSVLASWLWWHDVIDVPPIVIKKVGQVASVINIRGSMDVRLPTAVHRQEHSLSCEIASLKMALQTVGVHVSESELIAQLPFDTTQKGGGIWGDPNKGFVGNIDGKMLIDGYGVYWDPIANLGLKYRRTEVIRGGTAKDVARHIALGRPVVTWGNYGRPSKYSWKTSDGSPIAAVNGEHARIVTGFKGSEDNPTSFSIIDPIYGPLTWSKRTFMDNWGVLGNHAVVVFPYPKWVKTNNDGKVWEISEDGSTRQWIRSWKVFVARGGHKEAVGVISDSVLAQYERGPDISN